MAAGKKSYRFTIRPRVKRCEPLRKAFMDLANEYGWPALTVEFCLTTEEITKKNGGRPKLLSNDKIMHVWIAVEIERYLKKKKYVDATVKEVFQELKMHGKPWLVFVGEKTPQEIKNAQTARRLHSQGRALMKDDPKLAKWWTRNLDAAKKTIDEKWSVGIKKRSGLKPAPQG